MILHRSIVFILGSIVLFAVRPGYGQNCSGGPDSCRTVVSSVDLLRTAPSGYGAAQYAYITITCYHASSANSICAGGGDFDRIPVGTSPCDGTDHDNKATIIRDVFGNCFYRKNFGLNGLVDARQCGVTGDGSTDDTTSLNNCINLAQSYKIGIVSTGGGVLRATSGSIQVVDNVELTCGDNMVGTDNSEGTRNDYRIFDKNGLPVLTNAIVIDPEYSLRLNGKNSVFSKCSLEAGSGNGNIYSPSVWYPNCDASGTPVVPCTETGTNAKIRSAMLEASAFTHAPGQTPGAAAGSVGITITNGHATVRDVTVLGFDTCYSVNGGPSPIIENLQGDCHTGITIAGSDVPHINGFDIHPLLTASNIGFPIQSFGTAGACSGPGNCNYTVTTTTSFPGDPGIRSGDVIWIEPTPTKGAESARGYWVVSNVGPTDPCGGAGSACTFTLVNSVASGTNSATAIIETGKIRTTTKNGVPATAITEIAANDANLKFLQIGQTVTDIDNAACFSVPTVVTAVWPATGVVYVSNTSQCDAGPHRFAFQDNQYQGSIADCPQFTPGAPPPDSVPGCIVFDADFRWGDGFHLENSGGAATVNCHVFEHMVAFHLYTATQSAFATNCATGNETSWPDRNLAALTSTSPPYGNIISLLVDGNHLDGQSDACEADWANSVLGQHRPYAVVVQSDCDSPIRIANTAISAAPDNNSGVALEVDAGSVSLVNAHATGPSNVNIAEKAVLYYPGGSTTEPAAVRMSNNAMRQATLNVQNSNAAASTEGCGNVFAAPTPYLCAPSSFTQLPGGRLTLTSGQPIMTADVTGAGTIYYAPYVSQQVPIYSSSTGSFGLADFGGNVLSLSLNGTKHLSGRLYDVFAEVLNNGSIELCTGPVWASGNVVRSASGAVVQINGVWVNSVDMHCDYDSSAANYRDCQPSICTYPGTFFATAAGQTSQQFNPAAAAGGSAPCLCLYNAYNHVTLFSRSRDSSAYTYNSSFWRYMDNSASNRVTVVDGLSQMQISAQLTDTMNNNGSRTAEISVEFNAMAPLPPPPLIVQANTATPPGSYIASAPSTPLSGLWFAQAVEAAPGSGTGAPGFGGSALQQLSVQVDD